ncbi:hypothetical protein FOA52_007732 [Chlamydomonas sp. UWO 241]|nr:hypothetical protein FOA52_007732 [Chlamydomonas sp. UWO 241]
MLRYEIDFQHVQVTLMPEAGSAGLLVAADSAKMSGHLDFGSLEVSTAFSVDHMQAFAIPAPGPQGGSGPLVPWLDIYNGKLAPRTGGPSGGSTGGGARPGGRGLTKVLKPFKLYVIKSRPMDVYDHAVGTGGARESGAALHSAGALDRGGTLGGQEEWRGAGGDEGGKPRHRAHLSGGSDSRQRLTQLSIHVPVLDGELESWQLSVLFDVITDVVASLSKGPSVQLLLHSDDLPKTDRHPELAPLALITQASREHLHCLQSEVLAAALCGPHTPAASPACGVPLPWMPLSLSVQTGQHTSAPHGPLMSAGLGGARAPVGAGAAGTPHAPPMRSNSTGWAAGYDMQARATGSMAAPAAAAAAAVAGTQCGHGGGRALMVQAHAARSFVAPWAASVLQSAASADVGALGMQGSCPSLQLLHTLSSGADMADDMAMGGSNGGRGSGSGGVSGWGSGSGGSMGPTQRQLMRRNDLVRVWACDQIAAAHASVSNHAMRLQQLQSELQDHENASYHGGGGGGGSGGGGSTRVLMALDNAVLSLKRGGMGCFVELSLQGLVYHSDLNEDSVGHARVHVQNLLLVDVDGLGVCAGTSGGGAGGPGTGTAGGWAGGGSARRGAGGEGGAHAPTVMLGPWHPDTSWEDEDLLSLQVVCGGFTPDRRAYAYERCEVSLHPLIIRLTAPQAGALKDYFQLSKEDSEEAAAKEEEAGGGRGDKSRAWRNPQEDLASGKAGSPARAPAPSTKSTSWFGRASMQQKGQAGQTFDPVAAAAAAVAAAQGEKPHAHPSSLLLPGGPTPASDVAMPPPSASGASSQAPPPGGAPLSRASGRRAFTADSLEGWEEPSRYGNMYRRPRTLSTASAAVATPDGGRHNKTNSGDLVIRGASKPKAVRFRHVRFNKMYARLSWEGWGPSISDFGLVLDQSVYLDIYGEALPGAMKGVMNRHKGRMVLSIMKSMAGWQTNKIKKLEGRSAEQDVDEALKQGSTKDVIPTLKALKVPSGLKNNIKAIKSFIKTRRGKGGDSRSGGGCASGMTAADDETYVAIVQAAWAEVKKNGKLKKLLGNNVPPRPTVRKLLLAHHIAHSHTQGMHTPLELASTVGT